MNNQNTTIITFQDERRQPVGKKLQQLVSGSGPWRDPLEIEYPLSRKVEAFEILHQKLLSEAERRTLAFLSTLDRVLRHPGKYK